MQKEENDMLWLPQYVHANSNIKSAIVENVFGHNVIRIKCTQPDIYKNKTFLNSINRLFETVKPYTKPSLESKGKTESTADSGIAPLQLPGAEDLNSWIMFVISNLSTFFDFQNSSIEGRRNWVNKMYKNSCGKIHSHAYENMKNFFVAIFYINAPKNGSDLVFVNKNDKDNIFIEECASDNLKYMNITEGELIIHPGHLPHGVSIHNSNEPRICMIVEYAYV